MKCTQFVASMEKGRSFGIDSAAYVAETQAFTMYLLGFQTGFNMAASDTYDIFDGNKNHYELLSWIENYCRSNASDNFGGAVAALSKERYPKRQKKPTK